MSKLVLMLFFIANVQAQDTIVFPKVDLFKRNIIEVSNGMPLGKLKDKYENSINSAVYFRTKVAKKQFIDFGLEIGALIKPRNVFYSNQGRFIPVESGKTTFLLGFRYTRFLYLSKREHFWIESNSGLGWKSIHYKKLNVEEYKELDFEPSLNTIVVSQGAKIMYHGLGIFVNYQYAPYDLFNINAESGFGGACVNFGLSGSWNF